ncbi:pyridoxal phosphate-dependent transferase [Paraphoma chrysanthemicola]|nr:pyridoxal phosphate-dependent transferase [Paraphoma chrysanthemicola]
MDSSINKIMLEHQLQDSLDRRQAKSTLRTLTLSQSSHVDFSSNDFLSLAGHPKLKAAFIAEVQIANTPLGSGGSRLLDGNSEYAERLEREIAEFHGAEAGLLFNSGFDANAGFFACVPQPGDIIVYDELIHASVHDGIRLSRAAKALSFQHNSLHDLEQVLRRQVQESREWKDKKCNVLVAIEAVYSMDGDIGKLKGILDLVDAVLGNERGCVIIDEAHSTGVLGPYGAGLVSLLGLQSRVFARLHTFGKSMAGNGAIILGSHTLRRFLINYARPLIYSTFMSYPSLALIRTAYGMLKSGSTSAMQKQLKSLVRSFFRNLYKVQGSSKAFQRFLKIPLDCPESPIFAIRLVEPKSLALFLQNQGYMVRAVVPPTVPPGTQRIRVCIHAGNTMAELDGLINALITWCEAQEGAHEEQKRASRAIQSRL